jgi:hypothetical protein
LQEQLLQEQDKTDKKIFWPQCHGEHGVRCGRNQSLFLKLFLLGPQAFVTTLSAARGLQRIPRVALSADLDV